VALEDPLANRATRTKVDIVGMGGDDKNFHLLTLGVSKVSFLCRTAFTLT
jgi:hypothetical protein